MAEGRVFDVVSDTIRQDAPDDDVADAFESWRKDLGDSDAPGKIQAYRIPIDEHGRASHSAVGQIRLGAWPIDQYDFDTLCQIIMKDYMLPNESIMAVRLIGTLAGKWGVRFNKIVQLQRANKNALVSNGKDGLADVMRAMQESNERILKLMAEMGAPKTGAPDGGQEMMRTVGIMRALMEPMQAMMGPILAAAIGRPHTPSSGGGGMREMLETMMMFDKFVGMRSNRGGGSGPSDFASIAASVSSVAKPLLEFAAANAQANAGVRRKALPPGGAPIATPAGGTGTVSEAARPQAPPVEPQSGHVPVPSHLSGHDLSTPTVIAPQPTQTLESGPMFAEIKKQIDALVEMASNGSDAIAVADLFYDQSMAQMPDEEYGKLAATIEDEEFVVRAALFNARVRDLSTWFQAFRTQLVNRIVQADSEG